MAHCDVIVLGGGIIGASIAEELARRKTRVILLERGRIGGEASKAAAGILSAQMDVEEPGPLFELCRESRRMYEPWVRRLERVSGMSLGFHQDGILYLALTQAEVRRMDGRRRWQRRLGCRVERWSAAEVRRREPYATRRLKAGFFFPTEAQIDNVRLLDALAVACRKAGVRIIDGCTATRILARGGRVTGVRTDRGTYRAQVVVNCLGSWAGLVDGLPVPKPPVSPARGQILSFDAPPKLLRAAVMSEAGYAVQRRTGELIVGSTVEFAGYDRRVTPAGMQTILSGFHRITDPRLPAQCGLRSFWAGLRPCSKDRMPILGATEVRGLYVATGHFRHGILLAPVTSNILSELILQNRTPIDLSPFSLARFR